jgi:multidrug transporter EmrE-like cation transporter
VSTPLLIVIGVVLYAAFAIFNSRAGGRIDPSLSSAIFNGLGAAIPLLVYLILRGAERGATATTAAGVVYSVLAGITIAAFSILLIALYGRGADLSVVFPIIYGGATAVAAVVGWVLFGETASVLKIIGVVAIVCGAGLLAVPGK